MISIKDIIFEKDNFVIALNSKKINRIYYKCIKNGNRLDNITPITRKMFNIITEQ